MKSGLRSILRSIRWFAAAVRGPVIIRRERISGLETLSGLHHTSHISVWPESESSLAHVSLGPGVFVGKDVEIAAYGPGTIHVGPATTFQDRCQVYGDVHVGAHCIFARNILVISTQHHFRDNATWLIRDQDVEFAKQVFDQKRPLGRKVWIEDDCWLGWGCAVMPGVYIGRGAVVGANSVVTSDIAPYEVHGGVPNAKIGCRLSFEPPTALTIDDAHLPYFYRGFRLKQCDLAATRAHGYIAAENRAVIVLAAVDEPILHLSIKKLDTTNIAGLRVSMNGRDCGIYTLKNEVNELVVPLASSSSYHLQPIPSPLQPYTFVELQVIADAATAGPCYGVAGARLNNRTMPRAVASSVPSDTISGYSPK